MLDALRLVIGPAPPGFEWVEYIIISILLLLIVKIVTDIFFSIFRGIMKW